MQKPSTKELFIGSLERCSKSKRYMPTFYHRFLSISDDIGDKFRHTNFEHQNQMLLHSLRLAAYVAAGQPEALRELRERAMTHDRRHLNIEPRLYDLWRASLIETSRQFDDQWDEDIEKAWYTVLEHVISYMVKHY